MTLVHFIGAFCLLNITWYSMLLSAFVANIKVPYLKIAFYCTSYELRYYVRSLLEKISNMLARFYCVNAFFCCLIVILYIFTNQCY